MFLSLSLQKIVSLLLTYKYLLLFPIAVLEGPIITVIAGFLASIGKMNFIIAYIVVVCGDFVGDIFYYAIGRWGGKPFLLKYGKYIGAKEERVEKMEKTFLKHSKKTLLFGKFSHAFGLVTLLSAGVAKQDFWEFSWVSLVGTMPKSMFLLVIGYYFGYAYAKIDTYISYYAYIVVVLVLLVVLAYFIFSNVAKKYFKEDG